MQFQEVMRLKPDYFEAHYDLGITLMESGQLEEAITQFERTLEFRPDIAEIHHYLGFINSKLGRIDSALGHCKQALKLRHDFGEAHNVLGQLFHKIGELTKAKAHYLQAIHIEPDLAEPYNNLGNLYTEEGDTESAVDYLRRATHIKPDYALAYVNLGIAMLDQGEFRAASEQFHHGCSLQPNNATLHGCWSHALLSRGLFQEGWAENELGLTFRARAISNVSLPFWDGSSLAGRSVLVLAEQGVGDEIMFLSCITDLLEKARPSTCIIECDQRLVPLCQRSFATASIQAKQQDTHWLSKYPETDAKIAIGSLPKMFRGCIEDFPDRNAYLIPDQQRVMQWKQRYQCLDARRVIGITWRGGRFEYQRRCRSTMLAQWAAVLSTPDTAFVNLQYGDCTLELGIANAELGVKIHDWQDSDPLADLDDYAAQIVALDLVISVDNSTAHLGGALGIPVWTLLSFVSEWRWMLHREDMPWYPTMRLIRQSKPGDWESVLHRVAKMLGA